NRQVSGARQTPVVEHIAEIAKHLSAAICPDHHPVDEIGTRQVQHLFGNRSALMGKQRFSFIAKNSFNFFDHIASLWLIGRKVDSNLVAYRELVWRFDSRWLGSLTWQQKQIDTVRKE